MNNHLSSSVALNRPTKVTQTLQEVSLFWRGNTDGIRMLTVGCVGDVGSLTAATRFQRIRNEPIGRDFESGEKNIEDCDEIRFLSP